MVRQIKGCELDPVNLSEECYDEMRSFLVPFELTAIEAQLILEVSNSRKHHIDINTLSKKVPKEFGVGNIEALIKKLMHDGYIEV